VKRAVLFAHELGHNSGAGHIESTNAGEFIMEPRINAGTNGFAQASKNAILNHIGRVDCIGTWSGGAPSPTPPPPTPTPPGDCSSGEIAAEIKLKTDGYASETSLALTRSDGSAVIRAGDLENDKAYTAQLCLPANDCYTVTVTDSVGDGICCGYGQGSFDVNVEGQRVGGGGDFEFEDSVSFGQCTPPSVDVGLFLRTDAYPEESRVALTDQITGERLWSFSFPEANTNYRATVSVDPRGCYVFELRTPTLTACVANTGQANLTWAMMDLWSSLVLSLDLVWAMLWVKDARQIALEEGEVNREALCAE
jgi:hypothetical protein